MRIAVISDVHANIAALEAVLDDIRAEQVSEILSLGDNIGYGPDPEEVIQKLQRNRVISIQGNHEYALVNRQYFFRMNPDPKRSLEMTKIMLSDESLQYSLGLEQLMIRHGARLVHGCPPKSQTAYLYHPSRDMLNKIFNSYPEKICFYGHTHTLNFFEQGHSPKEGLDVDLDEYHLRKDRKYIINPGSVGQPRDGLNNHAKYLIWDLGESTVTFKSVEYDVMQTVNKLRTLGFPEFNATRLLW